MTFSQPIDWQGERDGMEIARVLAAENGVPFERDISPRPTSSTW